MPDTVNRLITNFYVYKPLDQKNFEDVIRDQLAPIEKLLFENENGVNVAQAKVEMTPRYLQLLINETIIPSEGARHTALRSKSIIETDLRLAMSKLPRSKHGSDPVIFTLDYLPSKKSTLAKVVRQEARPNEVAVTLFEREVVLNFPRLSVRGRMPKERLKTSAHELGHALIGSLLGLRFERVVVVSTNPSAGGFVTFRDKVRTASERLAILYGVLASRAAERISMSEDPRSELAVMSVTTGPSMDLKMMTSNLYHMLYEWGFDPWGGTMSTVMDGYVHKDGMPDERIQKLGKILRRMENFLVDEMLRFRSQEWFVDKVAKLARAGEMLEADFYDLVGFTLPPNKEDHYNSDSYIETMFAEHIIKDKVGVRKAKQQKRGKDGETTQEFVKRYTDQFLQILKEELHPEIVEMQKQRASLGLIKSCRGIF